MVGSQTPLQPQKKDYEVQVAIAYSATQEYARLIQIVEVVERDKIGLEKIPDRHEGSVIEFQYSTNPLPVLPEINFCFCPLCGVEVPWGVLYVLHHPERAVTGVCGVRLCGLLLT